MFFFLDNILLKIHTDLTIYMNIFAKRLKHTLVSSFRLILGETAFLHTGFPNFLKQGRRLDSRPISSPVK
jgi:hypothetical protein